MLELKRKEHTVYLDITSGLKVARPVYPFSFQENDENNAELLKQHIENVLSEALKKARREAYEQGWKHAKAKCAKETWFSGWL